ncbi:MAG: NAD(P)-dependent oxidoreductase [Sphingomicrobium sp.]
MRVLAFDPHASADEMRAAGVAKRDDLQTMLGECDFVSIHCVLNAETRGLIGAALAH